MNWLNNKIIKIALISLAIIILAIYFMSQGIASYINSKWPPLNSQQQRIESISANHKIITHEHFTPDMVLAISVEQLKDILNPLIRAKLNDKPKLQVKGLSKINIKSVDFDFIDQGISVFINTTFVIDQYEIPTSGKISGDIAILPGNNEILFKPAFTSIELSPVSRIKESWLMITKKDEIILSSINKLIGSFIQNLNREVFANGIKLPLNVDIAKNFDPNEIKLDSKFVVFGDEIDLNIQMPTFVYFVNSSHIYLIGSKSNTEGHNQYENKEFPFADQFKDFTIKVQDKIRKSFPKDYKTPESTESIGLLRKSLIANLFNEYLNEINIIIAANNFYKIPDDNDPPGTNSFSHEILVNKEKAIPNCSGLRRKFKGDKCNNPCSYKDSCDRGCKVYKPHRCSAELACKAKRETSRLNCQRKKRQCELKREADRIALQSENEFRVNKCRAKRETMKLLNGLLKVGELNGQYWVNNSQLRIDLKSISISENLDQINLDSSLKASFNTKLRMKVNPDGLGHLACVFNFRKTLETNASISQSVFRLQGNISIQPHSDDTLNLVATIQPTKIRANLNPSPYSQLIKDPGFSLNCTFLSMTMNTIAGIDLLSRGQFTDKFDTLFGRFHHETKEFEIPLTLNPIKIGEDEHAIHMIPFIGKHTIGFRLKQKY